MAEHVHEWTYSQAASRRYALRYYCACGRWAYRSMGGGKVWPLKAYSVRSKVPGHIEWALAHPHEAPSDDEDIDEVMDNEEWMEKLAQGN